MVSSRRAKTLLHSTKRAQTHARQTQSNSRSGAAWRRVAGRVGLDHDPAGAAAGRAIAGDRGREAGPSGADPLADRVRARAAGAAWATPERRAARDMLGRIPGAALQRLDQVARIHISGILIRAGGHQPAVDCAGV